MTTSKCVIRILISIKITEFHNESYCTCCNSRCRSSRHLASAIKIQAVTRMSVEESIVKR